MAFSSVHDMVELCKESGKPLYEVILESDLAESGLTRAESEAEMHRLWAVMRSTSDGYCGADRSMSGFAGGDAAKVSAAAAQGALYADGFFAEDWELWLRWLHAGVRMAKLPQELLVWNDPPRRATRSDSRYCEAANNQLRALWLARWLERHNPWHPRVYLLGAGKVARRRLAPLWEKGVQAAAFVDIDPKKIGQKVHGVPVIGRDGLPGPGRCFLLNALTAHGADEDAARWLAAAGYDAEQWLLV